MLLTVLSALGLSAFGVVAVSCVSPVSCCPRLAVVMAHPQEHLLAAGADISGGSFLVCLKCGCWASKRPVGLAEPCAGKEQIAGSGLAVLRRIARKRHPLHGGAVLDGAVVVVDPSYQAVAAEVLDRFIEKGWQQKPASRRVALAPATAEKAEASPSLSEKPQASAVCSGPARLEQLRQRVLSRVRH